jgi:hypothetical protein
MRGEFLIYNPNRYAVTIGDLRDCIPPMSTVNLLERYKNKTKEEILSSLSLTDLLKKGILVQVKSCSRFINEQQIDVYKSDLIRPTRPGLTPEDIKEQVNVFSSEVKIDPSSTLNTGNENKVAITKIMSVIIPKQEDKIADISNTSSPEDRYCIGIRDDGTPCKNWAKQGKKFCRHHLASVPNSNIKRCASKRTDGKLCKNLPVTGHDFCWNHISETEGIRPLKCSALSRHNEQCNNVRIQDEEYCVHHLFYKKDLNKE